MSNKAQQGWGDDEQEHSPWVGMVLIGACILLVIFAAAAGLFKTDPPTPPPVSPSPTVIV